MRLRRSYEWIRGSPRLSGPPSSANVSLHAYTNKLHTPMSDSLTLQPHTKPKPRKFKILPKEPKRPPTNHKLKPKLAFKNVFNRNAKHPNVTLDRPDSSVQVPHMTNHIFHFTQGMTQSAEHLTPFPMAQTYVPYSSGGLSVFNSAQNYGDNL